MKPPENKGPRQKGRVSDHIVHVELKSKRPSADPINKATEKTKAKKNPPEEQAEVLTVLTDDQKTFLRREIAMTYIYLRTNGDYCICNFLDGLIGAVNVSKLGIKSYKDTLSCLKGLRVKRVLNAYVLLGHLVREYYRLKGSKKQRHRVTFHAHFSSLKMSS